MGTGEMQHQAPTPTLTAIASEAGNTELCPQGRMPWQKVPGWVKEGTAPREEDKGALILDKHEL